MTPATAFQRRLQQQQQAEQYRKRLEEQNSESIDAAARDYHAFQRLQDCLNRDLRRLAGIPSGAPRNAVKNNELLPVYLPVVRKYIASGEQYKNVVLVTVMIWLFDCGRIAEALDIARVAIAQQQPMPDNYKRNLPTFVADTIFEWADAESSRGNPVAPWFYEIFQQLAEENWPVPDITRMKFHKLSGTLARHAGHLQLALDHYLAAQELNPKRALVKTAIRDLKKQLEQQSEQSEKTEKTEKTENAE